MSDNKISLSELRRVIFHYPKTVDQVDLVRLITVDQVDLVRLITVDQVDLVRLIEIAEAALAFHEAAAKVVSDYRSVSFSVAEQVRVAAERLNAAISKVRP